MLPHDLIESFKSSLFAGQYNLLLGSGISLDSLDKNGKNLKSATELTKELCELKGVDINTPLSRVSLLLEPEETEKYITRQYLGCRPGETVGRVTSFVWKTVFTFNVDDALEAAYETAAHPKQKIESINYDEPYRNPPKKNQLLAIHMHGFTRKWESGYVFSTAEYGRVTRGLNPWMHVLSEILASEPFIIAGTSLNEADLEFYLAERNETSARTNRGPSILIEPYPNKITESVCNRHGLTLVKATLAQFLSWVSSKFEHAPTVEELIIPSMEGIFNPSTPAEQKLIFNTDFELVRQATPCPAGQIPAFFFGKKPTWSDLESSNDVPTEDDQEISAKTRNWLNGKKGQVKTICLIGEPGTGKTTSLRRTAYDLAKEGYIVFNLSSNAALDAENFVAVISNATRPTVAVIDNLADNAPSVRAILTSLKPKHPLAIISADRDYRQGHIERITGDLNVEFIHSKNWATEKYEALIEKIFKYGLLAAYESVHHPKQFAGKLIGDSAAVATCRALNNFKPIEAILKSIWKDANGDEKRSYAIASLAEHCYSGGLYYPILERAHANGNLRSQLTLSSPLPLTYADDTDYVYALHPVIADKLLHMLAREKSEWLLSIFTLLSNALGKVFKTPVKPEWRERGTAGTMAS